MRTLILVNPRAGSAGQASALRASVAANPALTLVELGEGPSGAELAARAPEEGYDAVVAAGGDGTIHAIVQGIVRAARPPRLGIIPLGTGNDLARSLGVPLDPALALAQIEGGRERAIDLIRVDSDEPTVWCVNVAAGGFSGQVDEAMTDEMKATWGPLAYVRGAISVLPDLTHHHTTLAYDDGAWQEVSAFNVVVANGRTCAGGIRVAPDADLSDGLMDVIVVERGSLVDMAAVGARLVAGDYRDHPGVTARRARRVRISSKPGMWFNVDGDLLTREPLTFTVEPGALRVIGVGEDEPASG